MLTVTDLRKISILKDLPPEELERLASVLKIRRANKNSFILYADDPGPSIMFIASGEVKITLLSDDGKEVVLATLESGEFFGEMAVLTGQDRSANVVAVSDCELFVLNADDFRQHLLSNSGLALEMLRILATRLRAATTKIGHLALYDVFERVARTLITLAQPFTDGAGEHLIVEKRPTHQELAAMVGTSREMVTRALKALEEDGTIRVDGKRIEILKR